MRRTWRGPNTRLLRVAGHRLDPGRFSVRSYESGELTDTGRANRTLGSMAHPDPDGADGQVLCATSHD